MQIEQHRVIPQTVPYSEQEIGSNKYYEDTTELTNGKVTFCLNIDVRKEMEDSRLNAIKQLISIVKGRLNFSYKSTTAANVDLTESFLDNWLKNNRITVDKIYDLRCLFICFTNFSFQIYFSTAENRQKNRILWSIGLTLRFVIDRLNTSASLYRIAPCLSACFLLIMLPWQRHIRQLNYQKIEVCVVNLLTAIFGGQRIEGFRGKGKYETEVSKTVFSHLN